MPKEFVPPLVQRPVEKPISDSDLARYSRKIERGEINFNTKIFWIIVGIIFSLSLGGVINFTGGPLSGTGFILMILFYGLTALLFFGELYVSVAYDIKNSLFYFCTGLVLYVAISILLVLGVMFFSSGGFSGYQNPLPNLVAPDPFPGVVVSKEEVSVELNEFKSKYQQMFVNSGYSSGIDFNDSKKMVDYKLGLIGLGDASFFESELNKIKDSRDKSLMNYGLLFSLRIFKATKGTVEQKINSLELSSKPFSQLNSSAKELLDLESARILANGGFVIDERKLGMFNYAEFKKYPYGFTNLSRIYSKKYLDLLVSKKASELKDLLGKQNPDYLSVLVISEELLAIKERYA